MEKSGALISLPVKMTAILLLFITSFAAVTGTVAFAYMADAGYYVESFAAVAGDRYNEAMNKYPDSDLKIRYEIENFMYLNKTNIIIWTVLFILVTLVLFVYLMYAAGRRRGIVGITLNSIDRIPLDIYAVLLLILLGVSVSFADNAFYSVTEVIQAIVTVPFIIILYLVLVSFLMTIAARLKTGGIFRNTLTVIALKFILKCILFFGKGGIWMIHRLPLLWKSILGFLLYLIFNTVLNVALINGGAPVVLFWFVFNSVLFFFICAVTLQLGALKKGGEKLAAGNLTYKIPLDRLLWDFRRHAENLNDVGEGMQRAVDERMKSEHFKTELITNVSHDIKTPLTSIINYVDLLKKENLQNETAAGYIDVLERQSARLKKLTDDLVDASKASSGSIAVKTERTDVAELIGQCVAEYSERFSAADIKPVIALPDYPIFIEADGKLLWRILDNLLGNICKYSLQGTRVYFTAEVHENTVCVMLRNISREPLNLTPGELMERFVRGDVSRNTEGSGLGLSIARSLTELQGGTLSIDIDGDLFKVILDFPRSKQELNSERSMLKKE